MWRSSCRASGVAATGSAATDAITEPTDDTTSTPAPTSTATAPPPELAPRDARYATVESLGRAGATALTAGVSGQPAPASMMHPPWAVDDAADAACSERPSNLPICHGRLTIPRTLLVQSGPRTCRFARSGAGVDRYQSRGFLACVRPSGVPSSTNASEALIRPKGRRGGRDVRWRRDDRGC
jgi:hypothetical protein